MLELEMLPMVMVLLAKLVPMHTVSVDTGKTPLSQFVTVVQLLSPPVPVQLILPEQASVGSASGNPEIIATTPPPGGTVSGVKTGAGFSGVPGVEAFPARV